MSRIGKMPIPLPDKVKIESKPGAVEVTGPLGKMVQALPPHNTVKVENNVATIQFSGQDLKSGTALHGLARSLVNNAVVGVTQGFKKDLEIVGLGYRASVAGDKLTLQLGFAVPVEFKIPAGLKVTVDQKQTALSISGINKYLVGETAAQIRRLRKPEPYKGSGVRYAGEHIIKKAGKAAAGAAGAGATGGGAKKVMQGAVLERYQFRRERVRRKIRDLRVTRPRLSVNKSSKHTYAQVIDDANGKTVVSASSLSTELKSKLKQGGNIAAAEAVGELVAKKALEKGIKEVVFDRGGYVYHGRVKALAEAARKAGLQF